MGSADPADYTPVVRLSVAVVTVARLQRKPKVAERLLAPTPPNTVLARVPATCDGYGVTPRERQEDRKLADEVGVPYYDPRLGA